MKIISCFCIFFGAFSVFSAENSEQSKQEPSAVKPSGENKEIKPKIYADISKSAQDEAVSFDGIRGIFGLGMVSSGFGASVKGSSNFTDIKSNLMKMYLGLEYSKSFKKGFLLAVNIGTDLGKREEKKGGWDELNKEYALHKEAPSENHSGKFEKSLICPEVALKCGYLLPSMESILFLKVGISRLNGVYTYNSNDKEVCRLEANVYVPSIGLGFERKINKKWGASLEANFPINRKIKSVQDSIEHVVKAKSTNIKLMATYSVSAKGHK
jgi:hypothetical protein